MAKRIYIVKIGKDDKGITDYLKENLGVIYPFEFLSVKIDIEVNSAFNPLRNQYLSTPLLLQLAKKKPEDAFMILGIFDGDLYADGLNFIFGHAEPYQGVAIISIHRLREEFYYKKENLILFQKRALKEAVHELGHLFGLSHCLESTCVMFFSNSIIDTDKKTFRLCRICEGKLKRILQKIE